MNIYNNNTNMMSNINNGKEIHHNNINEYSMRNNNQLF